MDQMFYLYGNNSNILAVSVQTVLKVALNTITLNQVQIF